jgi:hypothetical protein
LNNHIDQLSATLVVHIGGLLLLRIEVDIDAADYGTIHLLLRSIFGSEFSLALTIGVPSF